MRIALALVLLISAGTLIESKNVFCHYMMGNSYDSDVNFFAADVRQAASAGIDGFALNIGPDNWMPDRISKMFQAAQQYGNNFKLFISFDMAVMSDVNVLIDYVRQYHTHPNSFFYNGRYFVSTFAGESQSFGEGSVNDGWQRRFKDPLSAQGINIFFVPAWTALGPNNMFENHPVLDGAFSWAAWPQDNSEKNTQEDQLYMDGARRNNKIYMAAVSPWFFTHFSYKNWIYKSETLWTTRWEQVIRSQPELVEIITWNDFGESHYIGPIEGAKPAGSETWTDGYDHQAWLDLASYYIAAYKSGQYPSITQDKIYFWYRTHSKNAGRSDSTGRPNYSDWADDNIVVRAHLTSAAQIFVVTGGQTHQVNGQQGPNTFTIPFGEGNVNVSVQRNGQTIMSKQGDKPITNGGNLYNFNACVNMAVGNSISLRKSNIVVE